MNGDEMVTEVWGQMQVAQNRLKVHVNNYAEDDYIVTKFFI